MASEYDRSTKTPVEQFLSALHAGDVERVRTLLEQHEDVRNAVNEPISHFNSRPVARATKNLPLLDLLLSYGADLNLKSTWWAGGFGLLESGITPGEAAPLIARGAAVDVFAAAHLGMFDRLRELVDADPSLVHARGGDGKTPLHCARTVEIAQLLIDRGANIDTRDVDHESTPAQYLVRDAAEVARLLVSHGAWFDIFIAIGLRDTVLVERCLKDDPQALDHRIGQGKYQVAHDGTMPATREQIGDHRGCTAGSSTRISRLSMSPPGLAPKKSSRCYSRTPRRLSACSRRALRQTVRPPKPSSPRIPALWPASGRKRCG